MPSKPRSACPKQPCPHFRPCPVHRAWGEGLRRASTRFYASVSWRQLRAQVLAAEPRCRFCAAPATDVDHIVPRSRAGADERSNLRPLCHECHSRRTLSDFNDRQRR